MTLGTARNLGTHGSAAVAFLAMAQGGTYPLGAELLFLTLLVVGWRKGDESPPWLGRTATALTVVVGITLLVLVFGKGLDGVIATGAFCATLSLNRILARQGPADDPSIFLTSFIMLTVGAALTGDLLYGLWFIAFAVALTMGLTVSHLDREATEGKLSENARQTLLTRPLVQALFGLSMASLGMVAAFFVLFPRVNGHWLGRHGGLNPESMVGFASTVELGGQGVLRDDPRPALRVRLPEVQRLAEERGAHLAPRLDFLFRGEGLDTFDGRRWSVAPQEHRYLRSVPVPQFKGTYAEIEVLPVSDATLIFSPGQIVAAHVFSPASGPPLHLQARVGGDVAVEPKPSGAYRFQVWADPDPTPRSLSNRGTEYPADVRARDLQLPDRLDPRVPELARQWTQGLSDPAAMADAIRTHLRTDFTYTAHLPGEVADPLAHFLFERKAGHCEYFSTAMAILLRTLGVPAREVTGFAGAVLSPSGDYYLSRAGDAHSWVEVYFPTVGYTTFDPTPPSYLDAEPSTLRSYVAAALDVIEQRWESSVVDYNLISQIQLLSKAISAVKAALHRFEHGPDHLPTQTGLWILLLALAIATWRGIVEVLRESRAPRRLGRSPWLRRIISQALGGASEGDSAATLAYDSMLRALRKRGLTREATETPREFAARIEHLRRMEATHVWELTRMHEQARYGRLEWTAANGRRARELVRTLPRHRASPERGSGAGAERG